MDNFVSHYRTVPNLLWATSAWFELATVASSYPTSIWYAPIVLRWYIFPGKGILRHSSQTDLCLLFSATFWVPPKCTLKKTLWFGLRNPGDSMENISKGVTLLRFLFWRNLSNHEVGVNGSYLRDLVESHRSLELMYHKTQLARLFPKIIGSILFSVHLLSWEMPCRHWGNGKHSFSKGGFLSTSMFSEGTLRSSPSLISQRQAC